MKSETDIVVVGAGPLGVEMAAGLKRAGLGYRHFEAGQVGATMQWWAAGTRWFSSNERISIAGVALSTAFQEKASREEYLAYLRSVVEQFGLEIETYTRVTSVTKHVAQFELTTQKSIGCNLIGAVETVRAGKVILCVGGTERPNLLGVPGEGLPHVSHYFQDPHTYFHRTVLIVGGRNSAVEAALRCYRVGAKVHFSYHGETVDGKDIKYWLYPEFMSLVKAGKIAAHFQTRVVEFTASHAVMESTVTGKRLELAMDFHLLLTGYVADMSLAKMAGVTVTGEDLCPTYDAETMETNVAGVYIAGTAVAGTQKRYKVFLENCHVHVERVIAHLTGKVLPASAISPAYERPES